jgi:type II secretion system protein N
MASLRLAAAESRFPRGAWRMSLYGLGGVLVFLAFLAASFPYADAISSMLAPLNLKLTYDAQHMSPPIGAELENVRLVSTAPGSAALLLQSPAIRLAPTLGSLILGRPGLRLRADLYGGVIRATVLRRGALVNVNFDLRGLDLHASDALRQFGTSLSGNVSGSGAAEVRSPDLPDDAGNLSLDGENVAVHVGDFPPLHLGAIQGVLRLNGGTVTLTDVTANGEDLALEAAGTIQLASDLADSTLELHVSLHPTSAGRDHFGLFINMLPHAPAEGPYLVSGPILSPSIS